MDQRGYTHYAASYTTRLTHLEQAYIYIYIYILMKWYKVTGATGWQKMSDRACALVSIAKLYEGWTYTVEQGTYTAHNFKTISIHKKDKLHHKVQYNG